jgi:hypothetical protein
MARIVSGRARRRAARNLYALMVDAQASGVTGRIDGQRYPLIVFARAQDPDSARSSVVDHLVGCGWLNAAVRGVKRMADDLSRIAEPTLQDAASAAARDGYAIVAYEEPITN